MPTLLGTIAVCAILYFGREVLIPLALAALIAFVLAPLVRRLERSGFPRSLAVMIVCTLTAVPVVGLGWVVASQGASLLESIPQYRETLQSKLADIRSLVSGATRSASGLMGALEQPEPAAVGPVVDEPEPMQVTVVDSGIPRAGRLMWPILSPIATLVMVMVFAIFILLERDQIRDRISALLSRRRLTVTTHVIDEVATRVGRYLRMQLVINGVNGLITAAALTAFGVPNAVLWGILGGILRFIPYVGPVVAALFPIAISFIVSDSWQLPLSVAAFFAALELVGNVVEPLLQRSSTGVTSLALLLCAAFWAWIWGIPGLLLSTPITVCLAVAGQRARPLHWFTIAFADLPPLTPADSLYRRLISGEAADPSTTPKYEHPAGFSELADAQFLRVLAMANVEANRGDLDESRLTNVVTEIRSLAESAASSTPPPNSPLPPVLCIPAQGEADAAAAQVVAAALMLSGTPARALTIEELGSPLDPLLASTSAIHACVVALAPHQTTRARTRLRQLRLRHPVLTLTALVYPPRPKHARAMAALTASGASRVLAGVTEIVRATWTPTTNPTTTPG